MSTQGINRWPDARHIEGVHLSDRAKAIFGDVYTSCADLLPYLSPDHERRAFANALRYQGMNSRINQITTAIPDTCDWIWETSFKDWIQSTRNDIFWLSGKPGSGKSTLMKYLVGSPETKSLLPALDHGTKWQIIYFFFDFRATTGLANTEAGLLRSLLYQLVNTLPRKANTTGVPIDLEDITDAPDPARVVQAIVSYLNSSASKVILFVDGLDECGSNIRALLHSIKSISSCPEVRVCLASRPEPVLQLLLKESTEIKVQTHNAPGISSYVRNTCDEIALALDPQLVSPSLIAELIIERANGVFLWVYFSLEVAIERLLCGARIEEIQQELNELPVELTNMYDRILLRVPPTFRTEAAVILRLLESAEHVLTVAILFAACASIQSSLGHPYLNTMRVEQFRIRLQGFLGGVIEFESRQYWHLSNGTGHWGLPIDTEVRLLHETFGKYIRTHTLLSEWSSTTLAKTYPDHIWYRLCCENIIRYQRLLGDKTWNIIHLITKGRSIPHDPHIHTKLPVLFSCTKSGVLDPIFLTAMHMICATIQQSGNISLPLSLTCQLLAMSILNIGVLGKQIELVGKDLISKTTLALQSPLMLLSNDMIARSSSESHHVRSILSRFGKECRVWRHDLFFAAAMTWRQYLEIHSADLRGLSKAETRFLLTCLVEGEISIRTYSLALYESTRKIVLTPEEGQIMDLLLSHGYIEVMHVALYIFWMDDVEVPTFFQHALDEGKLWLADPGDAILKPGPLDNFETAQGKGRHLCEIWARLDKRSKKALRVRIELMEKVGVDVANWRTTKGDNLLHAVIDICRDIGDFRGVFDKLDILLDLGINFHERNAAGDLFMDRCRRLIEKANMLSEIYERSLREFKEKAPEGEDVYSKRQRIDKEIIEAFDARLTLLECDLDQMNIHTQAPEDTEIE